MTIDDETFNQWKAENKLEAGLTLQDALAGPSAEQEAKDSWDDDKQLLPGERKKELTNPNQLFVAFAPAPTKKPYDILPRYFTRMQLVDCENESANVDFSLTRYFEAVNMCLTDCTQPTVWFKPLINAPLGFCMFLGSNLRNIEVVSRQDYLNSQHGFTSKPYSCEFLPQTAGRMSVFAKYEFKVNEDNVRFNIRAGCSTDKYLSNYMRIKIIDKSMNIADHGAVRTFNNMNIQNLCLPKNEQGFIFIVEGNMPYNTTEGTLTIDVQSTDPNFQMDEIVQTEPMEWSDSYKPWKYGIIFREKIVFAQADMIIASMNLRLLKDG